MNKTCELLEEWGCDISGAMRRFLNDEKLYMTCLNCVLEEKSFEQLGTALRERNCSQAFDEAHNLKGVLANMGISPMYDVVVSMVEPLRAGNVDGHEENYRKLLEGKDRLYHIVKG